MKAVAIVAVMILGLAACSDDRPRSGVVVGKRIIPSRFYSSGKFATLTPQRHELTIRDADGRIGSWEVGEGEFAVVGMGDRWTNLPIPRQ